MKPGVILARQLRAWGQHCERREWMKRCARRATYTLSWREYTQRGQLISHHLYLCNAHTWHVAAALTSTGDDA